MYKLRVYDGYHSNGFCCCVPLKVAPGTHQQLSQKRAAEGDVGLYGQQGPPSYYDNSKRLRY